MHVKIVLLFCLKIFVVPSVDAYKTGAPCGLTEMTPGHGYQILNSTLFSLSSRVTANNDFFALVLATSPFKGMLLRAEHSNTAQRFSVGTFHEERRTFADYCLKFAQGDSRLICNESVITHSTSECQTRQQCSDKRPCYIQIRWNPPAAFRGSVQFHLTIVPEIRNYVKLRSKIFSVTSNGFVAKPAPKQNEISSARDTCLTIRNNWPDWCKRNCNDIERCCANATEKRNCARQCCLLAVQ